MLRLSINRRYFALSALQDSYTHLPRALPWAFTFRAFGAGKQSFSHGLGSDRV